MFSDRAETLTLLFPGNRKSGSQVQGGGISRGCRDHLPECIDQGEDIRVRGLCILRPPNGNLREVDHGLSRNRVHVVLLEAHVRSGPFDFRLGIRIFLMRDGEGGLPNGHEVQRCGTTNASFQVRIDLVESFRFDCQVVIHIYGC